ncbi:MAG: response regulator, partial [Muribaculaceae bacterium]|nr:response regulator [Muribaculaceae bacterium]
LVGSEMCIIYSSIYNIVPQYDPVANSYVFRHYAYHIRSNEGIPNCYNYRSVTKLSDGRLVFGGMNGYQLVNPDQYQKLVLLSHPKGRLSALKVNNSFVIPGQPDGNDRILDNILAGTDRISLDHDQHNLGFVFAPRDYDSPFKTEYYYRLDSTGDQWNPITGNFIDLPNLAPGKYNLQVCARTPEGLMSDLTDSIEIVIRPPWYQSIWAYAVYIIILTLVIAAIFLYLNDRQKQKLRIIQAEKEMLRQHQLNEMKLRFFTNISHDFRTPLSLIITPLESYMSSHHDNDSRHLLEPVHRNAVRLLNLVNQILDFRKLEVTGMPLHLSYGDIVSFIKEICSSFTLFSEDSGITLTTTSEIAVLNMYFDKDKISKIMMNLLSNAFKYTGSGGFVNVTVSKHDDSSMRITVADSGKGIPDYDKTRIFDRFYQSGDTPHTTMGCGIGLHIVKEFVMLHKGSVDVGDNNPCGTVFTVILPVNLSARSTETESSAAHTSGDSGQTVIEIPGFKTSETAGEKATIMLVEDNADFIEFMARSLSDEYNVVKAVNGKDALEKLNENSIDIIISDVMMDEMDGLELCDYVKSDIHNSHIPFILLTARSLAEDEMKGLESGADDYITKPFSLPILRQRIARLLEESRRSRDRFRRIPDIAPSEVTITSLDEQFLSEAIKTVEANMADPDFSVEMLSNSLGMHRTHLYKKLSGITGKTPIEFIRLIRLKRAVQYLVKSQLYISEIAYKVGFNNPRLFSKYFKEEFNMTPREYVKKFGLDSVSDSVSDE